MKKILSVVIVLLTIFGCSKRSGGEQKLHTDTDSVAYVLGMNIASQLVKMDSTINIEAVCRGMRDVVRERTIMTTEEAETFFLGYMNYTLPEKALALEEQLLADLAEANREMARTRSGITYRIDVLGDQQRIAAGSRDSLWVRYRIVTLDEKELYSSYERGDTLRLRLEELKEGMQESIKLIGEGGKVAAWIPSKLAYGPEGSDEFGIAPNATICFEMELIKLDKYAEWSRR